ncbi:hypothetical protein BKA69DRAFT_1046076 [Paraphysoderma sedebokerense]|nr:hypothetical protein BKA69DRAFT_1046076 [Paraphysoderma sedebokerense]
MPNETINIVVRRDRSSTTYKFTDALSKFSSEFRTQIGASSLPPWIIQHYNASGNGGVARAIHGFDYSIGYVGVASAYENHVPYATFINRAGKYVRANYQNIDSTISNLSASTVASLGTLNGDLDLNDISGADTYPIVGMTYYMLNRTVEQDKCELSRQMARYLYWTYTSQTAADIAHHLSFSVMHGKLLEAVLESLKSLSCRTPEKNVTLWAQCKQIFLL